MNLCELQDQFVRVLESTQGKKRRRHCLVAMTTRGFVVINRHPIRGIRSIQLVSSDDRRFADLERNGWSYDNDGDYLFPIKRKMSIKDLVSALNMAFLAFQVDRRLTLINDSALTEYPFIWRALPETEADVEDTMRLTGLVGQISADEEQTLFFLVEADRLMCHIIELQQHRLDAQMLVLPSGIGESVDYRYLRLLGDLWARYETALKIGTQAQYSRTASAEQANELFTTLETMADSRIIAAV